MDKYKLIYENITTFYRVNDALKSDLDNFCIECHGLTLDQFMKVYADYNSKSKYAELIIEELKNLNEEPCISNMEIMYEIIEYFDYKEAAQ